MQYDVEYELEGKANWTKYKDCKGASRESHRSMR